MLASDLSGLQQALSCRLWGYGVLRLIFYEFYQGPVLFGLCCRGRRQGFARFRQVWTRFCCVSRFSKIPLEHARSSDFRRNPEISFCELSRQFGSLLRVAGRALPDSPRLSPTLPGSCPLSQDLMKRRFPALPDSSRLSPTLPDSPRLSPTRLSLPKTSARLSEAFT